MNDLPARHHAHPFDRPVKIEGDNETHGVDQSPDAIGGCYGIGWYEAFRDRSTKELYRVHCSDGVNGGKDAHAHPNLAWMEECRKDIIDRSREALERGAQEVRIASEEWAVMLNFVFFGWLDPLEGDKYKTVGDMNRHLDEGVIGTINGIPVVVDPRLDNPLGSSPSDLAREIKKKEADIDHFEDIAESFGY